MPFFSIEFKQTLPEPFKPHVERREKTNLGEQQFLITLTFLISMAGGGWKDTPSGSLEDCLAMLSAIKQQSQGQEFILRKNGGCGRDTAKGTFLATF